MKKVLGLIAIIALVAVGCSDDKDSPSAPAPQENNQSIVDIASSNPDFSYLVQAVVFAGLGDALSGDQKLTVFAPVNSAFEKLATDLGLNNVSELLVESNKELVTNVLLYHVAPDEKLAASVVGSDRTNTLLDQFAFVKVENGNAFIGNDNGYAQIIQTDIKAKNGVIHVIDKVLIP